MAEFWQAYGNWILFALFFILMIGHHLIMGHGGHGGRRTAIGTTCGEGDERGHGEQHDEVHKQMHEEGNLDGQAEGQPHGADGSAATPHRGRGHSGCCH